MEAALLRNTGYKTLAESGTQTNSTEYEPTLTSRGGYVSAGKLATAVATCDRYTQTSFATLSLDVWSQTTQSCLSENQWPAS